MTTWILKKIGISQGQIKPPSLLAQLNKDNMLVLLILFALLFLYQVDTSLLDLIISTLSDAYLGVSIFISATLAVFYFLDRYLKANLTLMLNRPGLFQVPVAAFLGALPGCGGAIIVVTQFVNGQMTFGALVAVLISTMGDAAFLLLSQQPETALLVYSLSLGAGIISGYCINAIHGTGYMKSDYDSVETEDYEIPRLPSNLTNFFIFMLIPGTVLGLAEAFQLDTNHWFGAFAVVEPVKWIGFTGALLCIAIWISQPLDSWSARFAVKSEIKYLKETVVAETSFVSVWVILGFLCYELLVYFTALDLQAQFSSLGGSVILFAILLGFVPGCGPQIVLTTLYLNGVVPLAAQVANAISNDGDALFPAIALAPKAALSATLYSAVPAFIIGYAMYFLGWK
ncbi:putative manganese transporter [Bacterioplanoides sp. SCSIO 12839]|uniref:putative manganese transporter n=1 Tax=Bacterioplanoides sp. SCSIO 12839 TaxID=2829569 RepID=UPI002106CA6F|nr:putative manganese transporter [Bacterioplanoides sp. SCSIO 12839]UTW47377.1 arsenic efflux protein [Bacterioplanoides sp. SCSIO 12839]